MEGWMACGGALHVFSQRAIEGGAVATTLATAKRSELRGDRRSQRCSAPSNQLSIGGVPCRGRRPYSERNKFRRLPRVPLSCLHADGRPEEASPPPRPVVGCGVVLPPAARRRGADLEGRGRWRRRRPDDPGRARLGPGRRRGRAGARDVLMERPGCQRHLDAARFTRHPAAWRSRRRGDDPRCRVAGRVLALDVANGSDFRI
jgi:hypothetical protein